MNITAGMFLISNASLEDEHFEAAVVFITAYNDNGATGFVLNHIFNRTLNELVEFKHLPAFELYDGGPVEREHVFFVHCRPDLITGGTPIFDGVYLGGDFKQAVDGIHNKNITANDIKIFIGYCGWDKEQLQAEIEEGSWLVVDGDSELVFNANKIIWKDLWDKKK